MRLRHFVRFITTGRTSSSSIHRTCTNTTTYPTAIVENPRGLPVEISLISTLGHGAGNQVFQQVTDRQKAHHFFKDELNEPSSRIGSTAFEKGDATALYTFTVDQGHPMHRHQGHRIVFAIAGSGGAALRFSPSSLEELERDPSALIRNMHTILIPPDGLFTMRFDGRIWHQFMPHTPGNHPAFTAISAHTDESGGDLDPALQKLVETNKADIAALTELLPDKVQEYLENEAIGDFSPLVTALSDERFPSQAQDATCRFVRGATGALRQGWAKWMGSTGWMMKISSSQRAGTQLAVQETDRLPSYGDLLETELLGYEIHHQDHFSLQLPLSDHNCQAQSSEQLMTHILDGFLENRPSQVSRMMQLRNFLVKPLQLRTSPLGCPVSSLLSDIDQSPSLFAGRFPVLALSSTSCIVPNDDTDSDLETHAIPTMTQVILGADDKHLSFRTVIGVKLREDRKHAELIMCTKVSCMNWFGRFYMWAIDSAHRKYVAPALMRHAAQYTLAALQSEASPPHLSSKA